MAQQQGRFIAAAIRRDIKETPETLHYKDWGQLATIGRSRAILEFRGLNAADFLPGSCG
ncbi:MAG: hypothetical protein R2860_14190 [Desulfobacterales bacterium]